MSTAKKAEPVAPRTFESLQAATKLFEAVCLTPVKARTIAGAVKTVLLHYQERNLELPVSERTLRYWAEHGVVIAGHPELAQPFIEAAKLHDNGRNLLIELGRGDAAGLMLTEQTLDKAVLLMGSILDSKEGQQDLKDSPRMLNEMASRLTAILQARQRSTGFDLWTALEQLSQEDAEKAIERLLERHPALLDEIRTAIIGQQQG